MASQMRPGPTMDKDKSDALIQMDLVKIIRSYITTMVDGTQGYKALLVDSELMRVACTLIGRTELADHSVVLIEKIDTTTGKDHPELKAICFLRPTRENITAIKRELKKPRFHEYHIFFSNLLTPIHLQELAVEDAVKEQIVEVQEYYGDFVVVDPYHFSIPTASLENLISPRLPSGFGPSSLNYAIIDRYVQGLSSLFLSIRRRPVIRYQRGSDHVQKLADSLYNLTYKQQYNVFDFGSRSTPVLLILDRRDDPVTPLLMQWTYQAMVHELVGIVDNTVSLKLTNVPADQKEVVLDARQDDFYRKHALSNFGEIGASVKQLVNEFQKKSENHSKVESLEDMRRFMTEHVDFQRLQSNVSKHVNLMTELCEHVSKRNLRELSEAQQDLANPATSVTAAASSTEVIRLLRNPDVTDRDKVVLVALFALRFESDMPRVRGLLDYLVTAGVRDREPRLFSAVESVLKYAGSARRTGDLYASRSLLNKIRNVAKGLQGVDNVYTQHTPLLHATLTSLAASNLDPTLYPYMGSQEECLSWQSMYKRAPPRETVVFIVGGTTYEEARMVAEWNKHAPATPGAHTMRVILGGSDVLNSEKFLQALTSGTSTEDAVTITIG